jgi:pimeloyl-ACP methyl ester carboxylesterase
MKTKLYVFSGLGADKRIFSKLDLSAFDCVFIDWITPEKNETLQQYALRISKEIPKNASILGVSFGGMLAVEIANYKKMCHLFLISTAKTKFELPLLYRLAGKIGLVHLLPSKLLKKANILSYWFFGMKTREEKQLLKAILNDTDSCFLKWAMRAICLWNNEKIPENFTHIHGSADRILPFKKIKGASKIEKGGHLMVYTHAKDISIVMKSAFSD